MSLENCEEEEVRNILHTPQLDYFNIKGKHLINKVTGLNQFWRFSKTATLISVLPHSNADAKRVFSIVGLNKTSTTLMTTESKKAHFKQTT